MRHVVSPHLLATCRPRTSPAEPVPGCYEPPVQHPRGPESGQLAAGEEPAATKPDHCPDTLPPTGPAEDQLQSRVSHGAPVLPASASFIWFWGFFQHHVIQCKKYYHFFYYSICTTVHILQHLSFSICCCTVQLSIG